MAKKTAPSKKAAVKKSSAKISKPVAKTVKKDKPKAVKTAAKTASKPAAPAAKANKVVAKPVVAAKEKTTKKVELVDSTKKGKTVVSILESEPAEQVVDAKAEKTSKVKPVKVDRGNAADEKAKWIELNKKYGKDKAVNYKMTESFASLIPLQHKVLGWGFILTNENDRLEVLFENGIRMLISNYKN